MTHAYRHFTDLNQLFRTLIQQHVALSDESRCTFEIYEQQLDVNRNPYVGAMSVIQESELAPIRYGGYGLI